VKTLKSKLLKLWAIVSSQTGFDPIRTFYSICGIPSYFYDLWRFRKSYNGPLSYTPCLPDRYQDAGETKSEYFWQDLIVARMIHERSPEKHVDIGSRIDGFVAHIGSFREIEIFDVRAVSNVIPGMVFTRVNLTQPLDWSLYGYCDSVSCLHALEHFGLGRYGDTIDSAGATKGLANIANLLRKGGVLYLSTPIGQERVEFNANRVFSPQTIVDWCQEYHLSLDFFMVIRYDGVTQVIQYGSEEFLTLAQENYNLGIFVFSKE
jgi:hypothetical protein